MEKTQHVIVEKAYGNELGWEWDNGRLIPYSKANGVSPFFTHLLTMRINEKKPCNLLVAGSQGEGKSYLSISIARYVQKTPFTVDQIVFEYSEWLKFQNEYGEGYWCVMEEPIYLIGHRDWYLTVNKALVKTVTSNRFLIHPNIYPVINKSLIDKTVRKYLLQFMIYVNDRGSAEVFKVVPSKFDERVFHEKTCNILCERLDADKCSLDWCMVCDKFRDESCKLLRGQYELKRNRIQRERFREDYEETKKLETQQYTMEQLMSIAKQLKEDWKFTVHGNVEPVQLKVLLEEKARLHLNDWKCKQLSKRLTLDLMKEEEKNGKG